MKQFTLTQIHELTNIPTPTIRAWTLKAEPGVIYDGNNIKNVRSQLSKRYKPNEIQTIFGCNVDEIQIVKSVKTSKSYIDVDDLVENQNYIIHNYSLETEVTFKQIVEIDDDEVYIFTTEKGYKALSRNDLEKPNIKIEEC